jgi:peptide/nickel transport system permease protein
VFAAERRQFRTDVGVRTLTYLGAAVPTFLLADLVRRVIAPDEKAAFSHGHFTLTAHAGWFVLGPPTGGPVGWLRHLFLPAATLAAGLIAVYARYVRSSMAVELGRPYVTVARGKGLTERQVLLRHALRNSLVPVASLLSLELGGVVGASMAADGVFGSGGLASVFLGGLGHADPFELTAIVVMSAVLVSGLTLGGDLLVGLLDPRMSTS